MSRIASDNDDAPLKSAHAHIFTFKRILSAIQAGDLYK